MTSRYALKGELESLLSIFSFTRIYATNLYLLRAGAADLGAARLSGLLASHHPELASTQLVNLTPPTSPRHHLVVDWQLGTGG